MRGLLIKDIQLMFQRRRTTGVLLIVCGFICFTMEITFVLPYMMFLGSLLATSTLNYDDADNSYTYLLTFPVTRKQCAIEKYILAFGSGFVGLIVALIILFIAKLTKMNEFTSVELIESITIGLPLLFIYPTLMIPIHFKFGGEKSRLVIFVVVGIIAIVGFLQNKFCPGIFDNLVETIEANPSLIILVIIAVAVIAIIISILLSIRILQKKEF